VKVETYFQQEGRVGARRDWLLTSPATGEQYGCATSSWVMVNVVTRRLSRMPDAIRDEYRKLMPDPPKHCIDAAETRLKLPDISDIAECTQHVATPVHLDMNYHVNNTAYLTWILDSIPEEVQDSCVLAQYEVEYKAEGQAGMSTSSTLVYASMRISLVCQPDTKSDTKSTSVTTEAQFRG
jgi:fatty acyl-ACP thioesterase A